MLEQTLPTPIEDNDQLFQTDVLATTSESLGLDMESVGAKQEAWQNGECPGPDEIGRIEISADALQHLKDNLPEGYFKVSAFSHGLIDEDDEVATNEAYTLGLPRPIDDQSRQILRNILSSFTELIQQDAKPSGNGVKQLKSGKYVGLNLLFGRDYRGTDTTHIDNPYGETPGSPAKVRYLTTVSGPTTTFFVGNGLDRSNFDDDGDIIGELPESVSARQCDEGQVVRFLYEGDPHCAPTPEEAEFRIFLEGTIEAT